MKNKEKLMKKRLFGILFSLALVIGMMPMLGQTAYADHPQATVSPTGAGTVEEDENGDYCSYKAIPNSGYIFDHWAYKSNGSPCEYSTNPIELLSRTVTDLTAVFVEGTEYNLWVGGTRVTSKNMSGQGWSYTPASGGTPATLTLTGATISGNHNDSAIYAEGDLIINVTGDSTVTGPDVGSGSGIRVNEGDLEITGTSRLNVNGGTTGSYSIYGVHVPQHNITIEGTVDIMGGTTGNNSNYGVNAGSVTIEKGGELTATGGTSSGNNSYSIGVYASDSITVEGTLTAKGGDANSSYGINTNNGSADEDDDIVVNGTMTAEGNNYGIYASNNGEMTINSGNVEVTAENNEGIHANNVTINGGNVTATSVGGGISAVNGVTITKGTVNASSSGTNGSGIYSQNGKIIISGGSVTASATGNNGTGIEGNNDVEITGGNIEATGEFGIEGENVTVNGGTVNATGTKPEGGIEPQSISTMEVAKPAGILAEKTVEIKSGIVTAAGDGYGIPGTVKNHIDGTGWTDKAGSQGEKAIPINKEGQDLSSYRKVQFPAKVDPEPTPTPTPAPAAANASITVNAKTVSASTLAAAYAKAGVNPDSVATVVLGKKVKKIKKGSFQNLKNASTLVVKSKKLTKARVKGSLKGSSITKVKVNVGKKKTNKKYVKKYKKYFTKKNCGKKVRVRR
jgi:hypothetical protein